MDDVQKPWKDEFNPFLDSPLTAKIRKAGVYVSVFRVVESIDGPIALFYTHSGGKSAILVQDLSIEDQSRYHQLAFFCHLSDMEWRKLMKGQGEILTPGSITMTEGS